MIDIILPVYNNIKYTKIFFESLKNQSYKDFSIIVIDNGSTYHTINFLNSLKKIFSIKIIRNKSNQGYVKAINQGINISKNPYILFGNNDTILPNNLLENFINNIKSYGIITAYTNDIKNNSNNPILINYKGSPKFNEINQFSYSLKEKFKNEIKDTDYVFGHCMFIKRKVINTIGNLDEIYGLGNYDDIDFCKRAKNAGFKIGLLKGSFIYHFCHTTFKSMKIDTSSLIDKNFILYNKKRG